MESQRGNQINCRLRAHRHHGGDRFMGGVHALKKAGQRPSARFWQRRLLGRVCPKASILRFALGRIIHNLLAHARALRRNCGIAIDVVKAAQGVEIPFRQR
jgi:hypothetical protein